MDVLYAERGAGVSKLRVRTELAGGFLRPLPPRDFTTTLLVEDGWEETYGGGLGNHVDVVALEDDLVLLGLGLGDGDALEQLDVADALLTEEVAERGRTGSAQAGAQRLG